MYTWTTHPCNIMSTASILADCVHENFTKAVECRQVAASDIVLLAVRLPEGKPCNHMTNTQRTLRLTSIMFKPLQWFLSSRVVVKKLCT